LTRDLFRDLAWLPDAPSDFDARIRALTAEPGSIGAALRTVASHALNDNQLARIARRVARARANAQSLAPLTPFTLGILSNATPDFIASAIAGTGPRFGLAIETVTGAYDQALQDSMNPSSAINAAGVNAVLIAIDWRGLPLRGSLGSRADAEAAVTASRQYLNAIRTAIRQHSGAFCIVQNFAAPAERLFGSLDRAVPGSLVDLLRAMNDALAADLADSPDVLFDVAGLAETVGLARWHSPHEWNLAKLPFANEYLPLYADHVGRLIASTSGKSRRCLVMDLDNTMWGGVIGDDGLAGIRLAQGDATGEAYLELQRYALSLRERGVVLAVSSKNDDAVARAPFRDHPEMLIKESHLAVFQANWNDKPTNLSAIARTLSLGLESLVFLDDNPFERELVRQTLPQVAVVELPEDPALYARTLSASGYFELTRLSHEDLSRAGFYEGNAQRAELQKSVGDLDAYLASLDMEIVFQPFDEIGRARIAQLINKSNQYNLTTRRYSEADVATIAADPACCTLQVRLVDRFGDNGMISVVIARGVGTETWDIDTWLMSCRVLGRKVEHMVLRELLRHAAAHGARAVTGTFIPTDRNGLVIDHYEKLGFDLVDRATDGRTTWQLAVDATLPPAPPMRVRRSGFLELEAARP
jgi:FkbH-like protein